MGLGINNPMIFSRKKESSPSNVLPPEWLVPSEDIREKYSGIKLVEPKPIEQPKCTCNSFQAVSGAVIAVSGSYISSISSQGMFGNEYNITRRVSCKYPHYKMDYIK